MSYYKLKSVKIPNFWNGWNVDVKNHWLKTGSTVGRHDFGSRPWRMFKSKKSHPGQDMIKFKLRYPRVKNELEIRRHILRSPNTSPLTSLEVFNRLAREVISAMHSTGEMI